MYDEDYIASGSSILVCFGGKSFIKFFLRGERSTHLVYSLLLDEKFLYNTYFLDALTIVLETKIL